MPLLQIDGKEIGPPEVAHNDGMGWGSFRSDVDVVSYMYVASREELLTSFDAVFSECRDEIRRDDELVNGTSEFKLMAYCSLSDAFKYTDQLREAIDTYFVRDLLKLLAPNYHESARYCINSADNIEVTPDGVRICGRAYDFSGSNTPLDAVTQACRSARR